MQNGEEGFVQSNFTNNQLLFDAKLQFSVEQLETVRQGNLAIGEILVFSGLTDSDRRLLEGYLAHKWGLAKDLAIGHGTGLRMVRSLEMQQRADTSSAKFISRQ